MAATQKDDSAPWGAEDDEQLKALKAEGKTWRQIAEITGRSQGLLKEKWKPLNPDNPANKAGAEDKKDGNGGGDGGKKDNGGNNNEPKNEKQSKKQAKQAAKEEAKKADADPTKPASKVPSATKAPAGKTPSVARSDGQARFTMQEWMTLQEDDVFSFGELQCLSELMLRDERQRWQRIASAFYDKTGRRVHPEDVREKFGEMGSMGGSQR